MRSYQCIKYYNKFSSPTAVLEMLLPPTATALAAHLEAGANLASELSPSPNSHYHLPVPTMADAAQLPTMQQVGVRSVVWSEMYKCTLVTLVLVCY